MNKLQSKLLIKIIDLLNVCAACFVLSKEALNELQDGLSMARRFVSALTRLSLSSLRPAVATSILVLTLNHDKLTLNHDKLTLNHDKP